MLPTIEERVDAQREQVLELGGLYIIGTERHESRRIDNQLRGRAGRQGDKGESRFFLSAQDDLVRLFAGERIYKILDKLGSTDEEGNEEPIEAGMLSKQIEKAQRKVEEQHYLARKHTLEYDDVLNQQREVIYAYRDEVLEGRDMSEAAREEIGSLLERLVPSTRRASSSRTGTSTACCAASRRSSPRRTSSTNSTSRRSTAIELTEALTRTRRWSQYDRREEEFGEELMREVERYLLLEIIDQHWQEHLHDMDYLREGIYLRGHAQIDPLVAYKNEAFDLFQDLMHNVWADFARFIFHVEVTLQDEAGMQQQQAPSPRTNPSRAASSATGGGPRQLLGRNLGDRLGRDRPGRGRPARYRRPARRHQMQAAQAAGPAGRARGAGRPAADRRCRSSRSAATTRAGAVRARSTRSATAPERAAALPVARVSSRCRPHPQSRSPSASRPSGGSSSAGCCRTIFDPAHP